MSDKTKLGLSIIGISFLIGLFGDTLLRTTPWGLNVLLFSIGFLAAVLGVTRFFRHAALYRVQWLALAMLVFSSGIVWRDSSVLAVLNGMALFVALAMTVLSTQFGQVKIAGLIHYLLGVICTGLFSFFMPLFLLVQDIEWGTLPRTRWSSQMAGIVRGVIFAVPLLVVFGALFVAADAVFEGMVKRVFNLNVEWLVVHVICTGMFTWLAMGLIRSMLVSEQGFRFEANAPGFVQISIFEIGTVLTLLNALFLTFVVIQIRYLFGGTARVLATNGLVFSEYARRGFFELVVVAMLVLPLLLLAHWLLKKENPAHERMFRILAGIKLCLLGVIMVSALQRMRIYQFEYGQTQLRFYTTAFMCWLGVVCVLFAVTVLRGRREQFAYFAVLSAFIAIAGLNVLNPDARIVTANIERIAKGKRFDAWYAANLSADAVPALASALQQYGPNERKTVARRLLERWPASASPDWRTWNVSRQQALRTVWANYQMLEANGEVQVTQPSVVVPLEGETQPR
ncbi:MAG: DUF4173 domain-containing protein [Blastocatellia bacterium]|nr:DUF4173 domain-containing protein [Blastocatellia bacterium]